MKDFWFLVGLLLGLTLLSSCAKYDVHTQAEVTNEDTLDMEMNTFKSMPNYVA
jgi:hypothetical protein